MPDHSAPVDSAARPNAPLMTLPTFNDIFEAMGVEYGLTPRDSQLKLAELVRDCFMEGGILCGEAPTGTGKTLGYLAGALDAQANRGVRLPIVVATATVGLQEQIIRDDIPRLARVGAVNPNKVAVAKGRNRYFCPRTTAMLGDKRMRDTQHDMFTGDKLVAEAGTEIALDMLKAWSEKRWDGDRDTWPGQIPNCWQANCGANSETCVNRSCDYYADCPYMHSRQRLGAADLIIANHNIVLADLLQRSEEASNTVLPPKKYMLVIDEAHNLPEKAIATRRCSANLNATEWLRSLEVFASACDSYEKVSRALYKATEFDKNVFTLGALDLAQEMEMLDKSFASFTFNESGIFSYGLKPLPSDLQNSINIMADRACKLVAAFKVTAKAFADTADLAVGMERSNAVKFLAQTNSYLRWANDLADGLEMFACPDLMVRWIYRDKKEQHFLCVQPLEGQDVLSTLLWNAEMPVSLVSATLQIAGSFDRFRAKSGLPAEATTVALPPVFDYSRGFIHLPAMKYSPKDREQFDTEVVEQLADLYKHDISKGMLVLFTSRVSMRRAVNSLPEEMRARSLVQENRPVPEIVALHKERIDSGERSILVGLDSLAEGLDLPGKYCGHVVITRLPFAVPGDPVEDARREHMGSRWFDEAYLADMMTMLIQSTGRLIRREADHGLISILDSRLSTKSYTRKVFDALPGFNRGHSLSEYFKFVATRGFDTTFGASAAPVPTPKPVKPAPIIVHEPMTPKVVPPAPPEHPFPRLKAIAEESCVQHSGLADVYAGLDAAIERYMPHERGPFPDTEPRYLSLKLAILPLNSYLEAWTDRVTPTAVMIALRLANMKKWDEQIPRWHQVLSIRPDLLQFAQILRSDYRKVQDIRCNILNPNACRDKLLQGLASLGQFDDEAIANAVDVIEDEVAQVLSNEHLKPSVTLLQAIPAAARSMTTLLRY